MGLGVTKIEQKMKKNHLRWFWHVQRQSISEPVWKIESWNSEDLKKRQRRPKMTWMTSVKKIMKNLNLQNDVVENQIEWRRKINVNDNWNWYIGLCNQTQSFGIKAMALLL